MKRSGIAAGIFTFLDVVLIVVCVLLYMRLDRISPEMAFQANDIVYTEQTGQAELLMGITAMDDCDGDVTQRIVIEKIVENREDESVVVFYAVSDKAGNVTKMSRVFPARLAAEQVEIF